MILIQFDLILLITALGSTLIYLIWRCFSRFASDYSMTVGVYRALQFTILSFFLPITYLAIFLPHINLDGSWNGDIILATSEIYILAAVVSCVWLGGALCHLPEILQSIRAEEEFRRLHLPCRGREDELVRELSAQMGVRREITVHKGRISWVPAIGGIRHPHIYMDEENMSDETLRVIFRHELIHYKHRDVAVKWAIHLLSVVYWFHPLFSRNILMNDYNCWSEYACDVCVCRKVPFKTYSRILFALKEKASERMFQMNCMICEKSSETERRIRRMKLGQKERKRPAAWIAVLTGVMIFGSSALAYGAGLSVEAGYGLLYEGTVDTYEEESAEPEEPRLTEYTLSAKEADSENVSVEEEEDISLASTSVAAIDWTIKTGVRKMTSRFSMTRGQSIEIAVYMDPEDVNVRVGLVEPDDTLRYISVTGTAVHTFEIKKSGKYRVFIQNKGSSTVTATGAYKKAK